MVIGSKSGRAGPWPALDKSLAGYYKAPPSRPAPNLPPASPTYPCDRPHRRYLTRGWARKLYEPVIAQQRDILWDLHSKQGDEAIDAFRTHYQTMRLYEKKDSMSYLEKAAVDADMVKGWEEFQQQWAGKKKAEEELKRRQQEYQREQQRAAQQQQQQQQPRQAKPATGPRNASSKAAAGSGASGDGTQYGPMTEAETLAQQVLDAKQNLDDQTRAYDRARWQYPKPPLFVVNSLAHAVKRAQDELANAQQVEDIARRARLARAEAAKQQQGASSSTATQGAAKKQPAQQSTSKPTSKTATPKATKATQPPKTSTPAANSENPFAVDPAFLARIKAMNEAAQKKSADLQNKSDAEAEADAAAKRRKAERDEAFLESLKQSGASAGKGKGKQKATDADPPAQPSKYQSHPRYVSPTVEDAMDETKTRKKKISGSGIKKTGVAKSTTKKKRGPFVEESSDEEEEEEDLYS